MKAETAWKWMPAVVLSATFVFGVWRVMVAVDDPHFRAVENAYEKVRSGMSSAPKCIVRKP